MEVEFPGDIFTASRLPFPTMLISLVLACLFGGLLGLEREWRDKPAGLRTHILVSLAAATFALLTRDYFERAEAPDDAIFDIVRGVAGGGAVLAAGTIIGGDRTVRGLTTGAGMWLAAAVGLASGVGAYLLAGTVALLGFLILRFIGVIERAKAQREKTEGEAGGSPPGHDG